MPMFLKTPGGGGGGPRLIVTAYSPLPSFSKYLGPAVNKTMYYLQNRINVMKKKTKKKKQIYK